MEMQRIEMEFEDTENGELNSICGIPSEVREKIFNLVEQEVIVQYRLVCKLWRKEIDKFYRFHLKIDDSKTKLKWERLLQLTFSSIEVISFLDPPTYGLATKILKTPSILQTLEIIGPIHHINLYYLLSDTRNYLKTLKLCLKYPILSYTFPQSISNFNFCSLENFIVAVDTRPNPEDVYLFTAKEPILFVELLCNSTKNLKVFIIELKLLTQKDIFTCICAILSFLSNQFLPHLKIVDIEIMEGRHGFPSTEIIPMRDCDCQNIDLNGLKRLNFLERFRFVSSSSIGGEYFLKLLEAQEKLKFLDINFIPTPNITFEKVIDKNYKYLRHLEITDLRIWDEDGSVHPFDMSIFLKCECLEKLLLDRHVCNRQLRRRYDTPELINTNLLPLTLQELALNYFNILSSELYSLAENIPIRTLLLTQCGKDGDFGVNGTVLRKLTQSSTIVFLEISTMNWSCALENEILNNILREYGYTDMHDYFQISKFQQLLNVKND